MSLHSVVSAAAAASSSLPALEHSTQSLHRNLSLAPLPPSSSFPSSSKPKRSTPNWKQSEVDGMLDVVQTILPRGPDEWERVAVFFNARHQTDWCVDRIKTKWHSMLKARKPTGDPTIPPYIRRAKQLRARIEEKVCSGNTDEMQVEEGKEEVDADEPSNRPAPIEVFVDMRSPSASTSSSSPSPSSSSPASSSSNSSAYKRKRIDVDGITTVIKEAVIAQTKSTDALCTAVASQAKGFEALAQGVVQNGEMIRMMAQLLAGREGRA